MSAAEPPIPDATPFAPPPPRRRVRRILLVLGIVLLLLFGVAMLDSGFRQFVFGPKYQGVPLIAWQRFFLEQKDKEIGKKGGWRRQVQEALLYNPPDEGTWRRLSAEERRDILISLGEERSDAIRYRIAVAIHDAPASPELIAYLKRYKGEPNDAARLVAAKALHKHEPAATEFVPDLVHLMEDRRGFISTEVCDVLAAIGVHAPDAVLPPLLSRIKPDGKVSHAALETLAQMGPAAREATPMLLQSVKAADWRVRALVIRALGRVQAKESVAPVIAALSDPDFQVRLEATHAVAHLGEAAKEAVPMLLSRIKSLRPGDATFTNPPELVVLGKLGAAAREAIPELLKLREDDVVERHPLVERTLTQIDPVQFPPK